MLNLLKSEEEYVRQIVNAMRLERYDLYHLPKYIEDFDYVLNDSPLGEHDTFTVKSGATKMVIVSQNLPYVIKFPLLCDYCYESLFDSYGHRNGDTRRCYSWDVDESRETGAYYALERRRGRNYCRAEAEYYALSKFYGISDIFVETDLFGIKTTKYDKWPIYIQSKKEDSYDGIKSCWFREDARTPETEETLTEIQIGLEKKYGRYNHWSYFDDTVFLYRMIQYYGEDFTKRVLNFCYLYHINDMHSGNIGYEEDENGLAKPYIYDYSGFHNG